MKSKILLLLCFIIGAQLNAQVPDFTVTDIEGNTHNLYEYLEEGKVVVLDVSATWCSNCWSFHKGEYLENIMSKYGPDGTDQVMVIFYEADKNTGQDALEGGSGSKGNWIEGTNYPIINENPLTIDMSVFNQGFPTVSVIRPSDKTIVADLSDNHKNGSGLAAMEEIIEAAFPVNNTTSLDVIQAEVFPNPFNDFLRVQMNGFQGLVSEIQLVNVQGQLVDNITVSSQNVIEINTSTLENGVYIMNFVSEGKVISRHTLVK